MKKELHPELVDCTFKCSCGATFVAKSNKETQNIEVCNECHAFISIGDKMSGLFENELVSNKQKEFIDSNPLDLSYLKAGLVYADRITTVSRTYKNDLCSFEGGYGLQSIFSYRYKDFYGIVNGIDYEQNNLQPFDILILANHVQKHFLHFLYIPY